MAMVDVSSKPEMLRESTAAGTIRLKAETIRLIKECKIAKGNPLYTAKIAGVLAAKNTSALIPLCHQLPLTSVEIRIELLGECEVEVTSTVKTKAQTGVEMEALTATSVALLTIWDMVKQYEKDQRGQYPETVIENIRVLKKTKEGPSSERKHEKT
jgi:cyclic pyranopterin phosphate synthase